MIVSSSKNPSTPWIKISRLYHRKSWQVYHFEIKKNYLILVIRFTAQSQSASMACYGASLKNGCSQWDSQRSLFRTAGRGERSSGNEIDFAVNRIGRIRLFLLIFQNGCSKSFRFPTAGQRKPKLWHRACVLR